MPQLCFVTTCMGRLEYLKQTLPRMAGQRDCSCVVVDYSCPENCGDWVATAYPQVRVVRVSGRTTFSPTESRNAGLRAAETPWVCMCDADVLVAPLFAQRVFPLLCAGRFFRPEPHSAPLTGTFVAPRDLLARCGGYDDVYKGWGEQDMDVFDAMQFVGARSAAFPADLVAHLPHTDTLRTRHYTIKDRRLSYTLNRIYRFIKFDLMRLSGAPLPKRLRERLSGQVREIVDSSMRGGKAHSITIVVKPFVTSLHGWRLDRTLTYRFGPTARSAINTDQPTPARLPAPEAVIACS